MASGFITLEDGRCWARTWRVYDWLLRLVIDEMPHQGEAFREWLRTRLPQEEDIECGYCFIRQDTNENVVRNFDLRELTEANRNLFWKALQRTTTKMIITSTGEENEYMIWSLKTILKMHRLIRFGDNPDNLSDWKKGYRTPLSGEKAGPGW